jgi:hypothetical protein
VRCACCSRDIWSLPVADLARYTSDLFTCFDNSNTIAPDQINDDYCDCTDGSDEPGTSACVNSVFWCANRGAKGQLLPSSRVRDGVCDCCDGTDEVRQDGTSPCANTCEESGRAAREALQAQLAQTEAGLLARATLLASASETIATRQAKIAKYTSLLAVRQAKLDAAKEVKEREEAIENEERAKRQAEADAKRAVEDAAAAAADPTGQAAAPPADAAAGTPPADAAVTGAAPPTDAAAAAAPATPEAPKENFPFPPEYAYQQADDADKPAHGDAAAPAKENFPFPPEYAAPQGDAPVPLEGGVGNVDDDTIEPEYIEGEEDDGPDGDDDDDDDREDDEHPHAQEGEAGHEGTYVHPGESHSHSNDCISVYRARSLACLAVRVAVKVQDTKSACRDHDQSVHRCFVPSCCPASSAGGVATKAAVQANTETAARSISAPSTTAASATPTSTTPSASEQFLASATSTFHSVLASINSSPLLTSEYWLATGLAHSEYVVSSAQSLVTTVKEMATLRYNWSAGLTRVQASALRFFVWLGDSIVALVEALEWRLFGTTRFEDWIEYMEGGDAGKTTAKKTAVPPPPPPPVARNGVPLYVHPGPVLLATRISKFCFSVFCSCFCCKVVLIADSIMSVLSFFQLPRRPAPSTTRSIRS